MPTAAGVCVCVRAAGLLSLFYPKFVSRGKTSLAGDVPAGLAGECLCHPRAVHASELITERDSETCSGNAFRVDLKKKRNVAHSHLHGFCTVSSLSINYRK